MLPRSPGRRRVLTKFLRFEVRNASPQKTDRRYDSPGGVSTFLSDVLRSRPTILVCFRSPFLQLSLGVFIEQEQNIIDLPVNPQASLLSGEKVRFVVRQLQQEEGFLKRRARPPAMADTSIEAIEAETSSWVRTVKDLGAGAAGGVAQVLLGECFLRCLCSLA